MLATALRGSTIFQGAYPDEVSSFINQHIGHHSLEVFDSERMGSRLSFREFAGLGLSQVSYGSRVRVRSPELESIYHFQIITRGECAWGRDGERMVLGQGQALMVNPYEKIDLEYSADCEKLIIKVPECVISDAAVSATNRLEGRSVRFRKAPQDLKGSPGLLKLLETVFAELEDPGTDPDTVSGPYREIILRKLLHVFPNNAIEPETQTHCPPALHKILQYIEQNLKQNIGIEDLSSMSNMSVRSIYNLFSRNFCTTPKSYLKQMRLQKLREELLGGRVRNVTEVALDYGFCHLGRFSSDYRKAFGELPSETIKRSGS